MGVNKIFVELFICIFPTNNNNNNNKISKNESGM
jgi:hypothetical protein